MNSESEKPVEEIVLQAIRNLKADPNPNGYTLNAIDLLRGALEQEPNYARIASRRVEMLGWKPGDDWKTG